MTSSMAISLDFRRRNLRRFSSFRGVYGLYGGGNSGEGGDNEVQKTSKRAAPPVEDLQSAALFEVEAAVEVPQFVEVQKRSKRVAPAVEDLQSAALFEVAVEVPQLVEVQKRSDRVAPPLEGNSQQALRLDELEVGAENKLKRFATIIALLHDFVEDYNCDELEFERQLLSIGCHTARMSAAHGPMYLLESANELLRQYMRGSLADVGWPVLIYSYDLKENKRIMAAAAACGLRYTIEKYDEICYSSVPVTSSDHEENKRIEACARAYGVSYILKNPGGKLYLPMPLQLESKLRPKYKGGA